MQVFGVTLGEKLRGGETIELIGDVGAGKTTLTRAIARGLGITDPILSPTFTISNRYSTPTGTNLAHYDFYRLSDAGIMKDELGEVLEGEQTITIIEWGDIIADVLPDNRLTIRITSLTEQSRELQITAVGSLMERLVGLL